MISITSCAPVTAASGKVIIGVYQGINPVVGLTIPLARDSSIVDQIAPMGSAVGKVIIGVYQGINPVVGLTIPLVRDSSCRIIQRAGDRVARGRRIASLLSQFRMRRHSFLCTQVSQFFGIMVLISANELSVDSPAAEPLECTDEAAEYVRDP
jgi:hypothetical protein